MGDLRYLPLQSKMTQISESLRLGISLGKGFRGRGPSSGSQIESWSASLKWRLQQRKAFIEGAETQQSERLAVTPFYIVDYAMGTRGQPHCWLTGTESAPMRYGEGPHVS